MKAITLVIFASLEAVLPVLVGKLDDRLKRLDCSSAACNAGNTNICVKAKRENHFSLVSFCKLKKYMFCAKDVIYKVVDLSMCAHNPVLKHNINFKKNITTKTTQFYASKTRATDFKKQISKQASANMNFAAQNRLNSPFLSDSFTVKKKKESQKAFTRTHKSKGKVLQEQAMKNQTKQPTSHGYNRILVTPASRSRGARRQAGFKRQQDDAPRDDLVTVSNCKDDVVINAGDQTFVIKRCNTRNPNNAIVSENPSHYDTDCGKETKNTTPCVPKQTTVYVSEQTTYVPEGTTVYVSEETTYVPEETSIYVPVETTYVPEDTTVYASEETTYVPEETTVVSEETTYVPEVTTVVSEETTYVPEETTVYASDETTYVPEETTVYASEETTYVPEETTVYASEEITYLPEETTVYASEETTYVHEKTTGYASEETTYVPEETTVYASEEITYVPEKTTVYASEETTYLPEETTVYASEETTYVHEKTTGYASEETTYVPEETTGYASEETTYVPEETTVYASEETTDVPEETTIYASEETTYVPEETTVYASEETTAFTSEETTAFVSKETTLDQYDNIL